jgi:hypothetical protein
VRPIADPVLAAIVVASRATVETTVLIRPRHCCGVPSIYIVGLELSAALLNEVAVSKA